MGIGTNQRIGVGNGFAVIILAGPYDLGEMFDVHLVADASPRRNDAEIVERILAPAQELVAFAVTFELDFHVFVECVVGAKEVDHDRVVNDEVNR